MKAARARFRIDINHAALAPKATRDASVTAIDRRHWLLVSPTTSSLHAITRDIIGTLIGGRPRSQTARWAGTL